MSNPSNNIALRQSGISRIISNLLVTTAAVATPLFLQVNQITPRGIQVLSYSPNSTQDTSGYLTTASNQGFPFVRFSFIQNVDTSQVTFTYRVATLRLTEFTDTIPVRDSPSFCSLVDAAPQQWTAFVSNSISPSPNILAFNYSTTFTGALQCRGLVVGFDVLLTNQSFQYTAIPGLLPTTLLPNTAKYVLRIYNFPYRFAESRLSIVSAMFAGQQITVSNGTITTSTNQSVSAVFTFSNFAESSNGTVGVRLGDLLPADGSAVTDQDPGAVVNEDYQILPFNVETNQPSFVLWDPVLAIGFNQQSAAMAVNPASLLAMAAVFFALTIF